MLKVIYTLPEGLRPGQVQVTVGRLLRALRTTTLESQSHVTSNTKKGSPVTRLLCTSMSSSSTSRVVWLPGRFRPHGIAVYCGDNRCYMWQCFRHKHFQRRWEGPHCVRVLDGNAECIGQRRFAQAHHPLRRVVESFSSDVFASFSLIRILHA